MADLVASVGGLVADVRAPLKADLKELHDLAAGLNKPANQAQLVDLLDKLPGMMKRSTRTGTYGSWYNYYICGFVLNIQMPRELQGVPVIGDLSDDLTQMRVRSTAPRCADD